jgi:hypothetical protein
MLLVALATTLLRTRQPEIGVARLSNARLHPKRAPGHSACLQTTQY